MTSDEPRMTSASTFVLGVFFGDSCFVILSSFVLRDSSVVPRTVTHFEVTTGVATCLKVLFSSRKRNACLLTWMAIFDGPDALELPTVFPLNTRS